VHELLLFADYLPLFVHHVFVAVAENPKGVLIASDVAARGLDIPNIQHVLHYQVPHTVEVLKPDTNLT